jgi:hypothetical protein
MQESFCLSVGSVTMLTKHVTFTLQQEKRHREYMEKSIKVRGENNVNILRFILVGVVFNFSPPPSFRISHHQQDLIMRLSCSGTFCEFLLHS